MDADARRYVDRRIRLLTKRIDNIATNLGLLDDAVKIADPRHIAQTLTDVPIGTSTLDITIVPPMAGTYGVALTPVVGQALVGKLTATIQPLSKTADGFTVALLNTTLAVIAAAGLDITIIPD
jgi:hypothetical protein